jgi:hypothetical protein
VSSDDFLRAYTTNPAIESFLLSGAPIDVARRSSTGI